MCILDASRIRSGSGYARGEIVKLRWRGGGGRCSGARDRSGLCITLELAAFPAGVPGAPRIHPVIIKRSQLRPITPHLIISWTITDEERQGGEGRGLFKRGWGEKRKRHGSRSAALIAAGNRATMKLISNTEISGRVSRGGKKWLPENGDGKSVRVYRSIVETDCELLQCKSYELCSHWFRDYAIRLVRRIDSFFIDLKETRVS